MPSHSPAPAIYIFGETAIDLNARQHSCRCRLLSFYGPTAKGASATSPQPEGVIEWLCRDRANQSDDHDVQTNSPPTCLSTQYLSLSIRFPNCLARYSGGNFTLGSLSAGTRTLSWAGLHADFWNTWDQAALTEYVNEC